MPRVGAGEPRYGLVYSGSLGTWYMAREMVSFARAVKEYLPRITLFLTPQVQEARGLDFRGGWAEIHGADPAQVPSWLQRATAMFFFIKPGPSKIATCPTKFAEGLAAGLPVVCNRGIGDLDDVVEREGVGVLVDGFSESAYRDAGQRLHALLRDPEISDRCRRLAESHYGLPLGVRAYHQLYRDVLSEPSATPVPVDAD